MREEITVKRIPRRKWLRFIWPSRQPIQSLGLLARVLAESGTLEKTGRHAYWRCFFGGDHWGIILLTHGRKGEPQRPEYQYLAEPVRLSPKWAARAAERQDGGPSGLELWKMRDIRALAEGPMRASGDDWYAEKILAILDTRLPGDEPEDSCEGAP